MTSSYILQIHTGSFLKAHTDIHTVLRKISDLMTTSDIRGVIFGWHLDQKLNEELLDFFHRYDLPCYFWLPVLSEMDQVKESVLLTDYTGKKGNTLSLIEDESFSFLCPSHEQNAQNVIDLYISHLKSLPFDGIFLDKIRFPSFANSYAEGFGCFCPSCTTFYQEQGIDLEEIKSMIDHHDPHLLLGHYDQAGHYLFAHPLVRQFYTSRSHLITSFVGRLCDYFHEQHLRVGLDIYAPFFAYHCGQDIQALSQKADFMKPMFYRYTQAPAGMQYEYNAYLKYFKPKDFYMPTLEEQMNYLKQAHCEVYPGIEINPIDGICDTNVARFQDNLQFFKSYSDTIVCCWNCLLMDDQIRTVIKGG